MISELQERLWVLEGQFSGRSESRCRSMASNGALTARRGTSAATYAPVALAEREIASGGGQTARALAMTDGEPYSAVSAITPR
mgnify:CR=1 FL=1